MVFKWSTQMKIKKMTLNSSPNQMTMKARKRKMMKPIKTWMKRKRKKKVMSCKNLGIQTFTFLSLSLGKRRFKTKLRDGLISLQSGLHILSLRHAPLTNCKTHSKFLLGACLH